MPNLFEPQWDAEQDRPPFSWKRARLGRQAGAERLGASLFELAQGCSTFPLHVHYGNEELIVVVAGHPTLRTLDSERRLAPGEVVACPVGRAGAHRLDNQGDEAARVLVVSTMIAPELNEYPDSGKIRASTYAPGGESDEDDLVVVARSDASLDYLDGER
jgi:uncharacterized cupin superfamily protein